MMNEILSIIALTFNGIALICLSIAGYYIIKDLINQNKEDEREQLNIGVVSNSVCPKCGTKGYKTTLTENYYACKKCETWWANGC